MQVQLRHGLFPRVLGQGDAARALADQLLRMRREADAEEQQAGLGGPAARRGLALSPTVEALVVVDRAADLATPLMTQLTYAGLLDELYEINQNQVDVGAGAGPGPAEKKTSLDPAADPLYAQLRDANFAAVGPRLNAVARRLEGEYAARHAARSTAELHAFVSRLPAYQAEHGSLKTHTDLAEAVVAHTRADAFARELEAQQTLAAGGEPAAARAAVEELVARAAPLPVVLRLLCLESVLCGGVRQRELDALKRAVLQAYGYQHLTTLAALEKMGLLVPAGAGGGAGGIPGIPGMGLGIGIGAAA
ncbi:hypothetical protein KEM52_005646, partial [Ascosphaera acerosa]